MNENKRMKAYILTQPYDEIDEHSLALGGMYGMNLDGDLEKISENFGISKVNLKRLFSSIVVASEEDGNDTNDNKNVFDGSEIFDEYYKELVFENVKYDSRINYKEISKKLAKEKAPNYEYVDYSIEEVLFSFGGKHNLKILVKKNQGV